jgi:hypothetical protein
MKRIAVMLTLVALMLAMLAMSAGPGVRGEGTTEFWV